MNEQAGRTPRDSRSAGEAAPPGNIPDQTRAYFLQSAALPLMAMDRDGRIRYASRQLYEVLQVPLDSLEGASLVSLLRERDASVMRIHLDRVFNDHLPARGEVEVLFPGGAQWIRLVSHPGQDEAGVFTCWSCVENLTQARHAEKVEMFYRRVADRVLASPSLRDLGTGLFDLLRTLFGIHSGYLAMFDRHGRTMTVPVLAGTAQPPPAGKDEEADVSRFILSTGRIVWWHDLRASGETGGPVFTVQGTRPDDVIGVPIRDGGHSVGVLIVQTDPPQTRFSPRDVELILGAGRMVELYLARMKSHENELRLSAAMEQVSEVIMISDARGVLEYVNPAFENLTGYTREEALGRTTAILNSGQHDRAFYHQLWGTLKAGEVWRGRFINKRKDGTVFEEDAIICPVMNDQGEIAHFVAIKRLASQAAGASGGFSSGADVPERLRAVLSHTFRNMAMTLRSNADRLRSTMGGQGEFEVFLQAAGQAELLLDEWQLISAPSGPPERMDINQHIARFETLAVKLAGQGGRVVVDLAPRLPEVRIPSGELEKFLAHVLVGQGLAEGATALIRTRQGSLAEMEKASRISSPKGEGPACVVIELSVTGSGVEDGKPGGLVEGTWRPWRNRIDAWPAHLWIDPNVAGGLALRLYIPSAVIRGPVTTRPKEAAPVRAPGNETILVAEDDPGARRVMVRMLEDSGYKVLDAENGSMAIRAALYHDGPVDVLVTDIMMPDIDGRALAEQMAELKPGIRVVYASGYDIADLQARGLWPEGEKANLVKKPFRREELLNAIRPS